MGYTATDLQIAQERYDLTFPPDLVELLLEKQPVRGYDWRGENPRIRRMLNWPFELLQFDLENNGLWWPEWGDRPRTPEERSEVLRARLAKAPKLIPLISHRFIPEAPHEPDNPVFSMHGEDTIFYGANLTEYFENEFSRRYVIGPTKHIPFWSDLVRRNSGD